MNKWYQNAVFYHIYPLGLCDAPKQNDLTSQSVSRINEIYKWIPHMKSLGINALYLGPLFESTAHGYDTCDYFNLDRRLGTNDDLKNLCKTLHHEGIRIVFDGVFNHSGRDFFAFQNLKKEKYHSHYKEWFSNINFNGNNFYNDSFSYEGWSGCLDLVKYNLKNTEIKSHLLSAVSFWIDEFDIDGIRLDAADSIDFDFFKSLKEFTDSKKSDFWLMGEVVHGDYSKWANQNMLNSTTNYECYKGLYSSMNDMNMFEIGYSLQREFGDGGVYKDLYLYNFADNHDVNRIASSLTDKTKLYPLYLLLFTMPGIPSIYYGSEFGTEGKRTHNSDSQLRAALNIDQMHNPDLVNALKLFVSIRHQTPSLKHGDYNQIHINNRQLAFKRNYGNSQSIVFINIDNMPSALTLPQLKGNFYDILNNEDIIIDGTVSIPSNWGRILVQK